MRVLVQRVKEAQVGVGGNTLASIRTGLLLFVGFGGQDSAELPQMRVWSALLDKIGGLRIFPDRDGKMNVSLDDFGGELLVVSQFTLYADCRKGRRPSFHLSGEPVLAESLYTAFVDALCIRHPGRVRQGCFGADMEVSLVNWGPVTLWLDSDAFSTAVK